MFFLTSTSAKGLRIYTVNTVFVSTNKMLRSMLSFQTLSQSLFHPQNSPMRWTVLGLIHK